VGLFEKTCCPVCKNEALIIPRSNRKKCSQCWAYFGDFVSKSYQHNKRANLLGLPGTLKAEELELQFHKYEKSCALTGSTNLVIDHFICLDTGHGGTYFGNIVFLDRSLHERKGNKNPFDWLRDNTERYSLDKVFRLINDLATQNGLSISEYEQFVRWCYENPQRKKKIMHCSSLEKWRESILTVV